MYQTVLVEWGDIVDHSPPADDVIESLISEGASLQDLLQDWMFLVVTSLAYSSQQSAVLLSKENRFGKIFFEYLQQAQITCYTDEEFFYQLNHKTNRTGTNTKSSISDIAKIEDFDIDSA